MLARLALPSANARDAPPVLDDPRKLLAVCDAPVETVAAEVHVAPPGALVAIEGVPHGGGGVLRMRPRDHHPITGKQGRALLVDVLVRNHVALEPPRGQPRDDVGVVQVVERVEPGPEVQHGAQARRIEHAASVAVGVVVGQAELTVLVEVELVLADGSQTLVEVLGVQTVELDVRVGIGHVGGGRRHQRDAGAGLAAPGTDEEGDVPHCAGRAHACRVEAALPVPGYLERHVAGPSAVVEIVFVKVDGAVLPGRMSPVGDAAVPAVAGDAPRRKIDGAAVARMRPSVENRHAVDPVREIPGREQAIPRTGCRALFGDRAQPVEIGRRPQQHRPLDLAVVVSAAHPASVRRRGTMRADQERGVGCGHAPGGFIQRRRRARRAAGTGFQGDPLRACHPGLHREPRGDEVPPALEERSRTRRVGQRAAGAESQAQRARLVNLQREPRRVRLRPPPHHRLTPSEGGGRPDECGSREARSVVQPGRAVDTHAGPGVNGLESTFVVSVHRTWSRLEAQSRAPRVGVAAHDAHEVEVVPLHAGTAQLELEPVAGRHAQGIGVAEDSRGAGRHRIRRRRRRGRTGASPAWR